MKTFKFLLTFIFVTMFVTGTIAQIKVTSTNKVGIGTLTPLDFTTLHVSNGINQTYLYLGDGIDGPSYGLGIVSGAATYNGGAVLANSSHLFQFSIWNKGTGGYFVGINKTNPSYALDVNGILRVGSTLYNSDARLKENIEDLSGALSTLKKLKGVTYRLKNKGTDSNNLKAASADSAGTKESMPDAAFYSRSHIGFIAQEIQTVYPELVYSDKEGILSVDYVSLIPVLVEAIKELDIRLKESIEKSQLKSATATISGITDIQTAVTDISSLSQNSPNPFTQNTTISYSLLQTTQKANLYIYNMNGNQIKNIPIYQKGKGTITINGSELTPGIYLYSLIADGKEVDTKRMILTQ